jgi:hypothetical protein
LDSEFFSWAIEIDKELSLDFVAIVLGQLESIEQDVAMRILALLDFDFPQSYDCLSLLEIPISSEIFQRAIENVWRFGASVCRFLRKLAKRKALPIECLTALWQLYLAHDDDNSEVLYVIEVMFRVYRDEVTRLALELIDLENEAAKVRDLSLHMISFLVLYSSFRVDFSAVCSHLQDNSAKVRNAALWALHAISVRMPCFECTDIVLGLMQDESENAMIACEIISEMSRNEHFPNRCEVFAFLLPSVCEADPRVCVRVSKTLETLIGYDESGELIECLPVLFDLPNTELVADCLINSLRHITFVLAITRNRSFRGAEI